MRKAYLTSAARNLLGAAGGALGSLSASALGSLAEKLTTAQFSQAQESRADDFGFGFLLRNGYNPYAMADALGKIGDISRRGGSQADQILQLFSTHPGSAERSARMRAMADAHVRKTAALPAQAGQSA